MNFGHGLWLTWQLTRREITQRYRGTVLGMLWPFLNALLYLAIFSFVFCFVLKVRWASTEAPADDFAFSTWMIYAGLVPYLYLAEVITRSPTYILGAQSSVKRVNFPVSLLPVAQVNAATIIALINAVLLLCFGLVIGRFNSVAPLELAAIFVPFFLFSLGIGWLLSSITMFFRDVAQIAPVVLQVMMFMAPVFYPETSVPTALRAVLALNPLTYFAHSFREAMSGQLDLPLWLFTTAGMAVFAFVGFLVFFRLRPAFGDVI